MPDGTAFDKLMWRLAYLYLAIPFLLFAFGWLKWFYSIPLGIAVIAATWFSIRCHTDHIAIDLKKHRRAIWICMMILTVWVFFSGIGQFSYQNGDHYARNAVLKDLVEQSWPLVYDFSQWQPYGIKEPGEYMLVYYIGYWMPAALFGKLFGLQAAHLFLWSWTFAGVVLVFYFICRHLKKLAVWILLLFLLFGGMDIIPFIVKGNYHPILHLEWWHNASQQFTSNTSLLYWVFNQSVVPWLVIAMLFNRLPGQNIFFAGSLCFFYAPFPFIGLIPFITWFFFTSIKAKRSFKTLFSFQNVFAALLIVLVTYGYFSSVSVEKKFNLLKTPIWSNVWFYTIEFLALSILIFIAGKRKVLVVMAIVSLIILSFIQYRHTPDLMMRASIPALFILMLMAGEVLIAPGRKMVKTGLIIILMIGSVGSLNEIMRSVYYTGKHNYLIHIKKQATDFDLLQKPDLFRGKNPVIPTMLGKEHSFFFKTFCRKR